MRTTLPSLEMESARSTHERERSERARSDRQLSRTRAPCPHRSSQHLRKRPLTPAPSACSPPPSSSGTTPAFLHPSSTASPASTSRAARRLRSCTSSAPTVSPSPACLGLSSAVQGKAGADGRRRGDRAYAHLARRLVHRAQPVGRGGRQAQLDLGLDRQLGRRMKLVIHCRLHGRRSCLCRCLVATPPAWARCRHWPRAGPCRSLLVQLLSPVVSPRSPSP